MVKKYDEDWEITFQDTQALQRLRRKLLKAQGALVSSEQIATGLRKHWEDLRRLTVIREKSLSRVQVLLEVYLNQIRNHCDQATRLLQVCEGISKVVRSIICLQTPAMVDRPCFE